MLYNVKILISRLLFFQLLYGFLICCVMWKIVMFRLMVNQNAYIFKLFKPLQILNKMPPCHIWHLRRSSKKSNKKSSKSFHQHSSLMGWSTVWTLLIPKNYLLNPQHPPSLCSCSERPRFDCETKLGHPAVLNCSWNVAFAASSPCAGPGG